MCFFSRQTKKAVELENRFKAKVLNLDNFKPTERFNGFEHPQTPVIIHKERGIIQQLQWGLIPHWAKDDSIKKYTLNARIETLKDKPSFRNAVNNRCLIIADGYYEWQWLDSKGKKKQAYLITLPNNEAFAFAGLWSEWVDKTSGEILKSYTIVTTEANEQMSEIHNSKKRMPIVLIKDNESDWLNQLNVEEFRKPEIVFETAKI